MKKIYLLSAVALMGLASCNDFDDQFDLANQIGDKKQVTMELTDADYASISNLAANKALAAELDKSFTDGTTPYTDALKELKNTKYFSTLITADQFLPAFIQDKYPEADVDSKFKVTFNEYCGKSEYLSDFDKLTGEVTLSADDYSTAWEGKSTAAYLTPATMGRMSDVLDGRLPDAEEGDMIVVNYAYSDFEPAGGGSSDTPSDGTTKISDVIANTDGGEYAVKGIVCATYSRGFLMTDKTGYILVFKASDVKIGDEVKVTGTTTKYGGLMQFPKKDTELTVEVTKAGKEPNFKHPAYHYLDAAGFEEYVKNPKVEYVRYAGKLTISGNYYNVAVNGTEIQGSLANVPEGKVDASLNGAFVIVHGYAIGATTIKSGTTYLNTMILSVENAANSNSAKARAMRAAANGGANKAVVYKYAGGKWKVYSTDGAKVIAVAPEESTLYKMCKSVIPLSEYADSICGFCEEYFLLSLLSVYFGGKLGTMPKLNISVTLKLAEMLSGKLSFSSHGKKALEEAADYMTSFSDIIFCGYASDEASAREISECFRIYGGIKAYSLPIYDIRENSVNAQSTLIVPIITNNANAALINMQVNKIKSLYSSTLIFTTESIAQECNLKDGIVTVEDSIPLFNTITVTGALYKTLSCINDKNDEK